MSLWSRDPRRRVPSCLSCYICSFQVDIRFPQSGAPDPNCVTVTGLPENVEEAIDHILNLEEEYVSCVWTGGLYPGHLASDWHGVTARLCAFAPGACQGQGLP